MQGLGQTWPGGKFFFYKALPFACSQTGVDSLGWFQAQWPEDVDISAKELTSVVTAACLKGSGKHDCMFPLEQHGSGCSAEQTRPRTDAPSQLHISLE